MKRPCDGKLPGELIVGEDLPHHLRQIVAS